MNKRLLSLLVAVSVVTTATFSGGFPVFAGNEETKVTDAIESVETSILESVDKLLEKKNATGSDAEEAETPEVIKIDTEGQETNSSDIVLTTTAEDGMVVTLSAASDAFPYEDLELVAHVVTGAEAEEASEEIDAKKPAENTAKRVTYDIQVQSNGEEVQPAEGKKVNVSFKVADAPSGADEVTVYHHDEQDGKVEEIASSEIDGADTTVVDSGETSVSVSEDAKVTTTTTANDSEEEYYEDYELENDLTITGETDSFSLYTVDFTYDDKQISIAGDTDHNELSSVLTEIGITDAIVDAKAYMDEDCTQPAVNNTVTVDGKDLFRVYAENGTWYVDALNEFHTTHGLFIKTADAEYKVKVTDAKLIVVVEAVEGCYTYYNGQLVEDAWYIYGESWRQIAYYSNYVKLDYVDANGFLTSSTIDTTVRDGYTLDWWYSDRADEYGGAQLIYREVNYPKVSLSVVSSDTKMGTIKNVSTGNKVETRLNSTIEVQGSSLFFDGTASGRKKTEVKAVPTKDSTYKFDHWEIKDAQGKDTLKATEGTQITAWFVQKDDVVVVTAEAVDKDGNPSTKVGYISPEKSAIVGQGSEITGNLDNLSKSNILIIDTERFEAIANDGYRFIEWVGLPTKITSTETTQVLRAKFLDLNDPKTITFVDPYYGTLEKSFSSESVQVPNGAKMVASGSEISFPDSEGVNTIYAKATPNAGYEFVGWLDANGNLIKETTYINSDMRIRPTFRFTQSQYVLITANPGGNLIYHDETRDTVTIAVEGMTGTMIKKNPSDPSQLIIAYLDKNGKKVTESVNAIAKKGYMLADDPWLDIPQDVSFQKTEIKADFIADNVQVEFYVDDASSGKGSITGGAQSFSTTSGKTITKYGSRLMIEGNKEIFVATSSDAKWVFDKWIIAPNEDRITGNAEHKTTITAKFKYVEAGSVLITPVFDEENWGTVYPKTITRVEKGSRVQLGDTENVLKVGNETFTAVANEGKYFDRWVMTGATLNEALYDDASFEAIFLNPTGATHTVDIATPSGGSYKKSFLGNRATVPENARYSIKNGNEIVFGGGKANIVAIPDPGYEVVGWYAVSYYKDPISGKMIEVNTQLEGDNVLIADDMEIVAKFDYINYPKPYVEPTSPNTPSTGSGGGGGGSVMGALDKTNYHAEHTYGSMDAPINDGLWEPLNDGTWKYNWKVPMASAWGCIVNPYANAGAGQQPHGWFFFNPSGIMLTGWRLVDGKWYYLEPISNGCRGQLYTNTTTPDGYKVDENGAWIQ